MIAGIDTGQPECVDIGIPVHMRVPGQIASGTFMEFSSYAILGVEYKRSSRRFEPLKRDPKFSQLSSQIMDNGVWMIVE